jgi:hypothetical protein
MAASPFTPPSRPSDHVAIRAEMSPSSLRDQLGERQDAES